MRLRTCFLFILVFLMCGHLLAQSDCATPGQTPSTAFPVCGTDVFEQKEVPLCSSRSLFVPGCTGGGTAVYENRNPYWYKFTCFESGTLGFVIQPKNPADDYDWQLYDITGLDPDEVYTNRDIIVTGNWAGNPGNTGTSASGVDYIQCGSNYNGNEPRFARMPQLIQGHQYLLLVSHFTNTQSGYDLSFRGGTAVITDPKQPELKAIDYSCDGTNIFVKINKAIKCKSVAPDGSDFYIPHSGVKVIAAKPVCKAFDSDTLVLTLDKPLLPGSYEVIVKTGTDGNTLVDNCDNFITEGNKLGVRIVPIQPTPMDSIMPLSCAPSELTLVFRKRIRCASVNADGSEFRLTGPTDATIVGVKTDCDELGLSKTITLLLSKSLTRGGNYRVSLARGSDGDSFLDECAQETPLSSYVDFRIKDTVNADFAYKLQEGCEQTKILFEHDGAHGVDSWQWQLDYAGKSKMRNPTAVYLPYGDKKITLIASNGFCADTLSKTIALGPRLFAAFETEPIVCPEDTVKILNHCTGNIVSYNWSFGDGTYSTDSVPVNKQYRQLAAERTYPLTLTVKTAAGCTASASTNVRVLMSCYIAVPNAFTPNNDGLNDQLYPINALKADHLTFRVYNRAGVMVFESTDWQMKWDGNFKGEPQGPGVYAWTLDYVSRETGKRISEKGFSVLIR